MTLHGLLVARALLPLRRVRPTILAATVFTLAACSSNPGPPFDPGTSPGTVTLRLNLPSTRSFCDQWQSPGCTLNPHVTIATAAGQPLAMNGGPCTSMAICSSACEPPPCNAGLCISGSLVVTTVEFYWDGSYSEPSTCGSGTPCAYRKFVRPGRYVAHMCATDGTVSEGVDGGATSCTATGPTECVDVAFDLPGPSVVEATLP